jgi:hypothetical protein
VKCLSFSEMCWQDLTATLFCAKIQEVFDPSQVDVVFWDDVFVTKLMRAELSQETNGKIVFRLKASNCNLLTFFISISSGHHATEVDQNAFSRRVQHVARPRVLFDDSNGFVLRNQILRR